MEEEAQNWQMVDVDEHAAQVEKAAEYELKLQNCKLTRFIDANFVDKRQNEHADNPYKLVEEAVHNLFMDEIMIRKYNCALYGKILLQGQAYVSNQAIYFYSVFNDRNLLRFGRGKATKLRIAYTDMTGIEKAYNAKIFDNSIRIITKGGKKVFLTSFINRNNCFNLMLAFKKQCEINKRSSDLFGSYHTAANDALLKL